MASCKYFLGHPWSQLTKARETKVAEGDLATDFIEVISARGAFVWVVFTKVVFVGGIFVDVRLSGTGFCL